MEKMPLLGGAADQVFELGREDLGHSVHVGAQTLTAALGRQCWPYHGVVTVVAVGEIDADRKNGCARSQTECCRTSGQGRLFPEELDRDAVAVDIAVAQQTDDFVVA